MCIYIAYNLFCSNKANEVAVECLKVPIMRAVKQEVYKGVALKPCERCDVCCSFCWSCMRRRSGGSSCCGLILGDLK